MALMASSLNASPLDERAYAQSGLIFPQTEAERAAGVMPANLTHPPGNVQRYGARGDGSGDDTNAIASAFLVAAHSGPPVVLPAGRSFTITSYVRIYSDTHVQLLGKLRLTGRASGLFADGAANIAILGFNVGTLQDATVASSYRWNAGSDIAPAIHVRSSTNVLIEGLVLSYVSQGILISNATTNMSPSGPYVLEQHNPVGCKVRDCHVTFAEWSGIASINAEDSGYYDNYVYRCGDGGLWMMGGLDCEVIGNHRISPYADPAAVARHGANNPSIPATWNDEQGIEFEGCRGVLIADNVVKGFWGNGIDVKNACHRVIVLRNRVCDCENASINVREGDSVKNACHKVSIVGNTISGHGRVHFGIPTEVRGAIRVGECFSADVLENILYSYQTTPGINCVGPGKYLASWYLQNPHQASLAVNGNVVDFKSTAFENDPEFMFTSATPGAIVIEGEYDAVLCNSNRISTDRYFAADGRLNSSPAISLTYVRARETCYPTSASASNNQITNWGHHGIVVTGVYEATHSGLVVQGNAIGTPGGSGIILTHTHRAACSGNVVNQPGAGSGQPGVMLAGSPGRIVEGVSFTGNVVTGRYDGGATCMTYALDARYLANLNASNNTFAGWASGAISISGMAGDHIFAGTTGFWRSGSGSPDGTVAAYWRGELYFDSSAGRWWAASSYGSAKWTPLGSLYGPNTSSIQPDRL